MSALAQLHLSLCPFGHTINFEKSDVFCTKNCKRPHLKNPFPLVRKISALDNPLLDCRRLLWIRRPLSILCLSIHCYFQLSPVFGRFFFFIFNLQITYLMLNFLIGVIDVMLHTAAVEITSKTDGKDLYFQIAWG